MTTFTEVTEARYDEMLGVLPPAHWDHTGFLVGEPWTHRKCEVSKRFLPAFSAFIHYHGKFYESDGPMTIPEFKAVTIADFLRPERKGGSAPGPGVA